MVDYILFLDESGGHELNTIDPNFPVFCLIGCIFDKNYYHHYARPIIDNIKMKYWNKTDVVFHSREIRKHENDFVLLNNKEIRDKFYQDINIMMTDLHFSILSIIIDKYQLMQQYGIWANNPYELSLEFILERFSFFLRYRYATGYALAESRGRKEDQDLINLYKKYYDNGTRYVSIRNITSLTTKKKTENINGLQIADLVAYPIATKVIRPTQTNPAFDIIKNKIVSKQDCNEKQLLGAGIKIFPSSNNINEELLK